MNSGIYCLVLPDRTFPPLPSWIRKSSLPPPSPSLVVSSLVSLSRKCFPKWLNLCCMFNNSTVVHYQYSQKLSNLMQQLDSQSIQTLFIWSLLHWSSIKVLTVNKNTKKRKRPSPPTPTQWYIYSRTHLHPYAYKYAEIHTNTHTDPHTVTEKITDLCSTIILSALTGNIWFVDM